MNRLLVELLTFAAAEDFAAVVGLQEDSMVEAMDLKLVFEKD